MVLTVPCNGGFNVALMNLTKLDSLLRMPIHVGFPDGNSIIVHYCTLFTTFRTTLGLDFQNFTHTLCVFSASDFYCDHFSSLRLSRHHVIVFNNWEVKPGIALIKTYIQIYNRYMQKFNHFKHLMISLHHYITSLHYLNLTLKH